MGLRTAISLAFVGAAAAGVCTGSDPQTIAKAIDTCVEASYNPLTGVVDLEKYQKCMTEHGIPEACTTCYEEESKCKSEGCKADCLLGWCKSGCMACTDPCEEDLATCTGFPRSTVDPCYETTTEEVQDACKGFDPQVIAKALDACMEASFNIITGTVDLEKYHACLTEHGIPEACAACYEEESKCKSDGCKAECLLGECKSGCMACTDPCEEALATCTGFPRSAVDPCYETTTEEVQDACTGYGYDPQTVTEKASECATTSFNAVTGGYDQDKFEECMKESSVEATCAECFFVVNECQWENCKAACLLGWCKSGCLACREPCQEDLYTCTGFPKPSVGPCGPETETAVI